MKEVNPYELFDREALDYTVETTRGTVRYVNLDNAATTIPFLKVISDVADYLKSYGSIHRGSGQKSIISTCKYENARKTIREAVGGNEDTYVVFTKNTTEAINQAAVLWSKRPGKILVSDIEHSSNLLPWMTHNEIIQYKTTDQGLVELDKIEAALRENEGNIKLVVITAMSNISGYKTPFEQVAELAHRYGAKILLDACQYVQHRKLDMKDPQDPQHIDFCSFSGHKMYSPYGGGALLGPKSFFDEQLPYQIGGGNLPYITSDLEIKKYRTVRTHDPGTANAVGAVSMASAFQVLEELGYENIQDYEHKIVHYAFTEMSKIPGVKIYILEENLSTVIPFDIEGFKSKLVAEILANDFGIGVRAGSFCTYEMVRKLQGITKEQDKQIGDEVDKGIIANIPGLIRASFALSCQQEDAERLVEALKEIASKGAEHYHSVYEKCLTSGHWIRKEETEG